MERTSRAMFLLLALALPPTLCGCGLLAKWFPHKPKPDKDAATKDVFIGVIEMVNPEQRFVLVRSGMKLNLQAGWKLETRPANGLRSVLSVSPEQKLNLLSADITEGYPQKGEIVVLPPQLSTPAPSSATTPAPPSAPGPAGASPPSPTTQYSLPPPIP